MPEDAHTLGQVAATCVKDHPGLSFTRLSLGTLDCSTALLARALDESARAVGATALVGQSCARVAMHLDCEARAVMLRQESQPLPSRTVSHDATAAPLSAAIEFATFVDFAPSDRMRRPATPELATEVPWQPAADLPFGQMRLVVAVPATRDDALKAVGIAARRLFARHFASPNCVAERVTRAWVCEVQLFSPEWDERVVQAAP